MSIRGDFEPTTGYGALEGAYELAGTLTLSDTQPNTGTLLPSVYFEPLQNLRSVSTIVIENIRILHNLKAFGLGMLTGVNTIIIHQTTSLRSLAGLDSLRTVDVVTIERNQTLETVELPALYTSRVIEVGNNPNLVQITGFPQARHIGMLRVNDNLRLRIVDAFNSAYISETVFVHCPSLYEIGNFVNLDSVWKIRIANCGALRVLRGFHNLSEIPGGFEIACPPEATAAIMSFLPHRILSKVTITRADHQAVCADGFSRDVWNTIVSHLDLREMVALSEMNRTWYRRAHALVGYCGNIKKNRVTFSGWPRHKFNPHILDNWTWSRIPIYLKEWPALPPTSTDGRYNIVSYHPSLDVLKTHYKEFHGLPIHTLDLSYNEQDADRIGVRVLRQHMLPYFTTFEHLNLSGAVSPSSYIDTEPLRDMPSLDLSHCTISRLTPLLAAHTLILGHTRIMSRDEDESILSNLGYLNTMRKLVLSGQLLGDRVNELGNVSDLDVSHNEIFDVSGLARVQKLNLTGNTFLINVSMLGNVSTLILTNCWSITDLTGLRPEQELEITGTGYMNEKQAIILRGRHADVYNTVNNIPPNWHYTLGPTAARIVQQQLHGR